MISTRRFLRCCVSTFHARPSRPVSNRFYTRTPNHSCRLSRMKFSFEPPLDFLLTPQPEPLPLLLPLDQSDIGVRIVSPDETSTAQRSPSPRVPRDPAIVYRGEVSFSCEPSRSESPLAGPRLSALDSAFRSRSFTHPAIHGLLRNDGPPRVSMPNRGSRLIGCKPGTYETCHAEVSYSLPRFITETYGENVPRLLALHVETFRPLYPRLRDTPRFLARTRVLHC